MTLKVFKATDTGTVDIIYEGIELAVRYHYSPPQRGARDSLGGKPGAGAPIEPDYEAELDIIEIYHSRADITCLFTEEALEKVKALILRPQ